MTRAQDEREVALTAIAKVSEWIGFSAGCMKDGRPWDGEATTLRDEAKAALAVLGDALRSQDEYRRGVEDAARVAEGYGKAAIDQRVLATISNDDSGEWYWAGRHQAAKDLTTAIRALATSDDSAGGVGDR